MHQQPGNDGATISDDTVLEISTPDSGNVTFTGSSGSLWLDQAATFTGKVEGLGKQNAVDLTEIGFGADTTLAYAQNADGAGGGTLSVSDGSHTASIALLGNYMASMFAASFDGHGGTLITVAPQANVQPQLTPPHG